MKLLELKYARSRSADVPDGKPRTVRMRTATRVLRENEVKLVAREEEGEEEKDVERTLTLVRPGFSRLSDAA